MVAALFALKNEFLVEPELLDLWRHRPGSKSASDDRADDDPSSDHRTSGERAREARAAGGRVREDPLAAALSIPPGETQPGRAAPRAGRTHVAEGRELAMVLSNALQQVRIDGDVHISI